MTATYIYRRTIEVASAYRHLLNRIASPRTAASVRSQVCDRLFGGRVAIQNARVFDGSRCALSSGERAVAGPVVAPDEDAAPRDPSSLLS